MGSRLPSAVSLLLLLLVSSLEPIAAAASSITDRHYDSIFSFGDSYADTGNNPVVFGWYSIFDPVTRPPYGSTFFGRPTGRNSDGRLIIDFVAQHLGLPFLPPSLAHNGSFRQGANFAVGGATALDASFFHDGDAPGGASAFTLNTSLRVQLQWFESLKPKLCATAQELEDFFGRSLFFVGEFGVNDYHFSFRKKTMQEIRSFVPDIIRAITMAIERLIKHGAMSLVVPGVVPSGCSPPVLDLFADHADPAEYDSATGCLKEINELGAHHNSLLQDALENSGGSTRMSASYTPISSGPSKRWSSLLTNLVLKKTLLQIVVEGLGGTTSTSQLFVATTVRPHARIHLLVCTGTVST